MSSAFRLVNGLAILALSYLLSAAEPGRATVQFTRIAPAAAVRNVLLVGWDAAQREHVQQCLQRGELPNLAALAEAGSLIDIDISATTDTKAGWAQILTGYSAEVTGVYSNARFQPIPAGLSLFERLEQYYSADGIATLAVIGKDAHVGNFAPQKIALNADGTLPAAGLAPGKAARKAWRKKLNSGTVVAEDGVKWLEVPGGPYYITAQHMDMFENALHQNDAVGGRALEVLHKHAAQRFCLFVHFADVDSMGHQHGENSSQYTAALIDCDRWLGRLADALQELGLADDTLIYVTADHGFDEGLKSHKAAPYVFLATNDARVSVPAGAAGDRADITPTILEHLGLDPASCEPPLTGQPLN